MTMKSFDANEPSRDVWADIRVVTEKKLIKL